MRRLRHGRIPTVFIEIGRRQIDRDAVVGRPEELRVSRVRRAPPELSPTTSAELPAGCFITLSFQTGATIRSTKTGAEGPTAEH